MDVLNEKIEEAIRDNLPQQMAETLRKELESLKSARETLQARDKQVALLIKEVEDLKELRHKKWSIEEKEKELSIKEKEIDGRAQKITENELEVELAAQKKITDKIFQLVETLVKNPRSIEFLNTSETYPVKDQYGNLMTNTKTKFGTIEKKEEK